MAEPPSALPAGKLATREALIQAGMAVLAEQGLEAPSLDAICARAGFTRGAFYVHFEDREDFIAAVMDRVLGGFLEAILAPGSREPGRAEVVARPRGEFAHGSAIRLHRLIEACARSPRVRERWAALVREAIERVSKSVLEGQVTGALRADVTAEQIGALLLGLALGAVAAAESGAPVDPAQAREAMLALLSAPRAAASRRRG